MAVRHLATSRADLRRLLGERLRRRPGAARALGLSLEDGSAARFADAAAAAFLDQVGTSKLSTGVGVEP